MKIIVQSLIVGLMLFESLGTAWAMDWYDQQQYNKNQSQKWENLFETERRAGEWNADHRGKDQAPAENAQTAGSTLGQFLAFAEAARVETLRKNVRAYIAAADTGFESYKKGAPQVIDGNRYWSAK